MSKKRLPRAIRPTPDETGEVPAAVTERQQAAARAADIEWLILEIKKIVFEKNGVELIPEVRIVGEAA